MSVPRNTSPAVLSSADSDSLRAVPRLGTAYQKMHPARGDPGGSPRVCLTAPPATTPLYNDTVCAIMHPCGYTIRATMQPVQHGRMFPSRIRPVPAYPEGRQPIEQKGLTSGSS